MTTDTLIDALSGYVDAWSDGTVIYRNAVGQTHRIDGPAVIFPSGTLKWYRNGKLHRTDGAAVVFPNGEMCWFLNGTEVSEEEFNRRITTGEYRDA